ncbi:MAG: hypothetical protein E6R04_06760 [Spirochaetes bacterium]|nr:MAG: hypothetical protein E6R04_06760 [Spirochaetota bacterium]
MRLHTDPMNAVYDSANSNATLLGTLIPALSGAVDQMSAALTKHMLDDPTESVNRAHLFVRDAYQGATLPEEEKTNPLAVLLYGITSPTTLAEQNVWEFVARIPGRSIIDVRKNEGEVGSLSDALTSPLAEKFTAELHPLAHRLMDTLVADIIDTCGGGKVAEGGNPLWNPSELSLIASGMMLPLLEAVAEGGDPAFIEFPEELLHSMFGITLIEHLPREGIYATYRDKHAAAAQDS